MHLDFGIVTLGSLKRGQALMISMDTSIIRWQPCQVYRVLEVDFIFQSTNTNINLQFRSTEMKSIPTIQILIAKDSGKRVGLLLTRAECVRA